MDDDFKLSDDTGVRMRALIDQGRDRAALHEMASSIGKLRQTLIWWDKGLSQRFGKLEAKLLTESDVAKRVRIELADIEKTKALKQTKEWGAALRKTLQWLAHIVQAVAIGYLLWRLRK